MDNEIIFLAKKYVWWQPPKKTLENQNYFLAQLMTFGTAEDVFWLLKRWGYQPFIETLNNPPLGVFNGRSWHFWHYKLGLAKNPQEIPSLPIRLAKFWS